MKKSDLKVLKPQVGTFTSIQSPSIPTPYLMPPPLPVTPPFPLLPLSPPLSYLPTIYSRHVDLETHFCHRVTLEVECGRQGIEEGGGGDG